MLNICACHADHYNDEQQTVNEFRSKAVVQRGRAISISTKGLEPIVSHNMLANVEHLITNLKRAGEANYLWIRAKHADKSERLLIFRRQDDSLRKFADLWLSEQGVEQLAAFLSATEGNLEGDCGAMSGTAYKYVWVDDGENLLLWHKQSLIGRFNSQEIQTGRWFPRGWLCLPLSKIESCRSFLSDDWIKRGVAIHTHSGKQIVIASKWELGVVFDPTYDEIAMIYDTAWIHALARAIAQKTKLPLNLDEDISSGLGWLF